VLRRTSDSNLMTSLARSPQTTCTSLPVVAMVMYGRVVCGMELGRKRFLYPNCTCRHYLKRFIQVAIKVLRPPTEADRQKANKVTRTYFKQRAFIEFSTRGCTEKSKFGRDSFTIMSFPYLALLLTSDHTLPWAWFRFGWKMGI
jgi:hypothetical protein